MNSIVYIADKGYPLKMIDNAELRHVWVEARTAFAFYSTTFKGLDYVLLEQKLSRKFTPRQLRLTADRLHAILGKPVVFLFKSLSYVERNRLIEQDVFFIVSGKYVFLPNILIASRETEPMKAERLSSVAQWVLLAYLQGVEINHKTIKEIEQLSPYQYVTLTRASRILKELGLCTLETDKARFKHIVFDSGKRELFEKTCKFLIPPVKQRVFCDKVAAPQQYKQAGITALSHYSSLNPEEMITLALTAEQWRNRDEANFENVNPIEGDYCIEIWQYPPVPTSDHYVDKLSLALSLQHDHDPRVEKEVELMIEKLW